jgi:hypothetical protein
MLDASPVYPLPMAPSRKPAPDLWSVVDAAKRAELGEATIWRWLRAGLLTRYRSRRGGPRKTMVDLHEVLRVKTRPPADPVPPDAPAELRP